MGVSQVGFDEGKGKLQGYGGLSKQEVLELEAWHSEPASGSGQQEEKRKQKQKQKKLWREQEKPLSNEDPIQKSDRAYCTRKIRKEVIKDATGK